MNRGIGGHAPGFGIDGGDRFAQQSHAWLGIG